MKDWFGNPVFPARQVNEPTVIDLGDEHRQWLRNIHDFYVQPSGSGKDKDPRKRAAGWRMAQALQWASSSINAGLGYLIRQACAQPGASISRLCAGHWNRSDLIGFDPRRADTIIPRTNAKRDRQTRDDADIDDIEEKEDEVQVGA